MSSPSGAAAEARRSTAADPDRSFHARVWDPESQTWVVALTTRREQLRQSAADYAEIQRRKTTDPARAANLRRADRLAREVHRRQHGQLIQRPSAPRPRGAGRPRAQATRSSAKSGDSPGDGTLAVARTAF